MKFLYELTQGANILEASRWTVSRWVRGGFSYVWSFGKKIDNPMAKLGLNVAQQILEHEQDLGRAAAILLLIALDSAYNSVLAVSLAQRT
jgi:hypothetical protein